MEEEKIMAIKVFTPEHSRHHTSYYYYDENAYGHLKFGDVVNTSMGLAFVIDEDVPDEKLPTRVPIKDIEGVETEKARENMEKRWWSVILEIHKRLKEQEKK